MKKYYYTMTNGKSINELVNKLNNYCNERNMETQILHPVDSNETVIQAQSKHSNAKALIGQDIASTVVLKTENGKAVVEIGNSRWLDKTVLLTVSMIVFWWLAIPAGIGMHRQSTVNTELKEIVDNYFAIEVVV